MRSAIWLIRHERGSALLFLAATLTLCVLALVAAG
jgi:hypothetical protein